MSALPLSNTAEGGTDGQALSAAYSLVGSGSPFDTFSDASSYTTVATAAAVGSHGSTKGYRTAQTTQVASYAQWSTLGIAAGSTHYGRMYLTPRTVPGFGIVYRVYTTTSVVCYELVINSDRTVTLRDPGTPGWSIVGTLALTVGQACRIEWSVTLGSGTGSAQLRIFNGANVEGTTADYTGNASSLTTQANGDSVRVGGASATTTAGFAVDWDDVALSATGWIGPVAYTAPLTNADIEYHLSGGASNTNPDLSLSGAISSTIIASGAANNVWRDVTTTEETSGATYYKLIYAKNKNTTATWHSVVAWIDGTPADGTAAIGLDSAAIGSTAASSSADRFTAPSPAVTFSTPVSQATGLAVGDIGPGLYKAVWLRRTIPAGATAQTSDAISVRFEGTT